MDLVSKSDLVGCSDPVVLLSDLPESILSAICSKLDARELATIAQVCTVMRKTVADDTLWHVLALRQYPPGTVKLDGQKYSSYKELVLDGNRAHVVEAHSLTGASCTWRHNLPESGRWYECKLLQVAMSHTEPEPYLRLAFDARGHVDLRSPASSTLAVVSFREVADEQSAGGSWQLGEHGRPCVTAVWSAAHPDKQLVAATAPGHDKGVLQWSGHSLSHLLSVLDSKYVPPNCGEVPCEGEARALVFCYANNLNTQGMYVDYTTHTLLTVHEPGGLRAAWRKGMSYVARDGLEDELVDEGEAAERARWADLPASVTALGAEWWAPARTRTSRPTWHPVADHIDEYAFQWEFEGNHEPIDMVWDGDMGDDAQDA